MVRYQSRFPIMTILNLLFLQLNEVTLYFPGSIRRAEGLHSHGEDSRLSLCDSHQDGQNGLIIKTFKYICFRFLMERFKRRALFFLSPR